MELSAGKDAVLEADISWDELSSAVVDVAAAPEPTELVEDAEELTAAEVEIEHNVADCAEAAVVLE